MEDLLMSRTDERGVIKSGNAAFQRLSGYEWEELLGAPHKIVRHPHMPKGVFHLYWQYLKAGRRIGAYVKNRSKSGHYYWVFAVVIPVGDGFVSVRFKPSSKKFELVRKVYKNLLELERKDNLSPKDSEQRLNEMISELGYSSYDQAMSDFVQIELEERRASLRRGADDVLDGLKELNGCIEKIGKELEEVRGMFENIRGTPSNLRIQASRFGEVAITIQVISQNYDLLTREIEDANGRMSEIYLQLKEILDEDIFGMASAALLLEGIQSFETENNLPDQVEVASEARNVRSYVKTFGSNADVMLKRTEDLVTHVRQLQRIVSGLAVTRVMCRIEAAGLSGDAGGIVDIVDRLLSFQTSVMGSIERIDVECRDAHQTMQKLASSFAGSAIEARPEGKDASVDGGSLVSRPARGIGEKMAV